MSKQPDLELPLLHESQKAQGSSAPEGHASAFINFLSRGSPPSKYQANYSVFKFLTFLDVVPFIQRINQSTTSAAIKDLPLPYTHFNIEDKVIQFDYEWNKEKEKPDPNIIWALYRTFKKQFYTAGFIMFFTFLGRLTSTLMLGKIIDVITSKDLGMNFDPEILIRRAVLFSIIFLGSNLFNSHFWNHNYIASARIRMTLVSYMYKKLHTIALSSLQEINVGKVINLMANDLNDIDNGFIFIWPVILCPPLLVLTAYLMWDYFGVYTVVAIGGLFGSIFLSQHVSEKTKEPRKLKNTATDERIKLTNEIVECIRLLKMYAWEKAFKNIVETLRLKELAALMLLNKVEIFGRVVAEMSVNICAFIMFALYTLTGGVLTPEKVYTSMMLLNFSRLWCIQFPHQGRVFLVNAKVMRTRVEEILAIPDILSQEEADNPRSYRKSMSEIRISMDPAQLYDKKRDPGQPMPIEFKNYYAWWTKDKKKACLQNLNVKIQPGQVTAVIGKIGSGKSSFLLSMLREVAATSGQLICEGSVAYVEQEPIMFSQTVKENILFGLEYDETLYQQVLRACNLLPDFRQLPEGDKTIVGERGVTLSGGQKARVSLARALYSRSDIYFFDDPLSAVDSKVARHLFNYAIKGNLLTNKIIVLVTHHLTFAKEADRIIVFDEGKIQADGTFQELQSMDLDLLNIFKKENEAYDEEEAEEKRKTTRKSTMKEEQAKEGKTEKFKEEPTAVTWSTYLNYLKAGDNFSIWVLVVILFVAFQLNFIGFTRFMGYWAYAQQSYYVENENIETFDNSMYLFWGVIITTSLFILKFYKTVLMFWFAVNTNTTLHNQVLAQITRATVSFFDKTPIGTILNRFSTDMGNLDKNTWMTANMVMEGLIAITFSLVTICAINPTVLFPSVIIFFLLIKVQNYFRKPAKESKRLDLISRSPLYSEISATINGLLIIRVFRQGGRFIKNFLDLVYSNSRCYMFNQRVQRLCGMIQDLCAYVLTVTGIFLYIHIAMETSIEPGLFGLAIVMILEVCNRSAPVIRSTLEIDLQMQSAQRVLEYTKLPQEAPEHKPNMDDHIKRQFSGKWPQHGQIVFNNVYMRYLPTQDYVLDGLTFTVKPGMKVGCVGRTGAGKSSLIQVLFRMVEIEDRSESYIKIDGVNTMEIGLELLRKNLSIIPQTAAIFTGNIRRNIDPFGEFNDEQIWFVLEEVNLKNYVDRLEKKLDTDMTISSSIFSAGQKQLICLARALLRKSRIIVLDEATANVDIETDNFIQEKINERFKDATVVTVAHRLTTIAHYDKILVLDKGKVAEYQSPYELLVINVGDRRITNTDGIFAKMVISTGESMSRRIFDIAYQHYMNKDKQQDI